MSDVTIFDDKNVTILCLFKTNFGPVFGSNNDIYALHYSRINTRINYTWNENVCTSNFGV